MNTNDSHTHAASLVRFSYFFDDVFVVLFGPQFVLGRGRHAEDKHLFADCQILFKEPERLVVLQRWVKRWFRVGQGRGRLVLAL